MRLSTFCGLRRDQEQYRTKVVNVTEGVGCFLKWYKLYFHTYLHMKLTHSSCWRIKVKNRMSLEDESWYCISTHILAHCTLSVTKNIKKVGIIIFMLKELAHQLGRLKQVLLDRSTYVRREVSVDFSNSLLPLWLYKNFNRNACFREKGWRLSRFFL